MQQFRDIQAEGKNKEMQKCTSFQGPTTQLEQKQMHPVMHPVCRNWYRTPEDGDSFFIKLQALSCSGTEEEGNTGHNMARPKLDLD